MANRKQVSMSRLANLTRNMTEKELRKFGYGTLEKLENIKRGSRAVASGADLGKIQDKKDQADQLGEEVGYTRKKPASKKPTSKRKS
jgi:hypothetical protein